MGTFEAQVVGIGGKTARRIKDVAKGKKVLHVVSAWTSENGIALGQLATEEESRIRMGNAAENLNVLYHMSLNLLKSEKTLKRGIEGKCYNCALSTDHLTKVLNQTI